MANKKDAPEASTVATADGESRVSDLHLSGRINTTVETKTVVEDRTEEPVAHMTKRYNSEDVTLDSGTVLTNYTDELTD